MALTKKGTQTIWVEERAYLRHSTYPFGGWDAIQDKELGGQLLLVHPFPLMSIALVHRAIKFALKNGWKPGTSAGPVRLGTLNGFVFYILPHLEPNQVYGYLEAQVAVGAKPGLERSG